MNTSELINDGENGTSRYVEETELIYKTVEQYGAIGNGIADDTAAIQAAFNSLVPGDYLIFKNASYLVSAAMTCSASDITIDGKNCLITENTLTTYTITCTGNRSTIKNFRFQGTETLTTWTALTSAGRSTPRGFVRFLGTTGDRLQNVLIENVSGQGKRCVYTLQNCKYSKAIFNSQIGFFGTIQDNPSIPDPQYCRCGTDTGGNYNLNSSNSATFTGAIVSLGQGGFHNVDNNHGEHLHDNGIYNSSCPYNSFTGNHIQWVKGTGIKSRSNSNIITNNNIRHIGVGMSITGEGTTSVDTYNSNGRYCIIANNTISDIFTGPAISILDQDGYYSRDMKICNNNIFEHKSTGGQSAVRIITVKGVMFTGNTLQSIASNYAVEIRGSISPVQINKNAIIENNQIYDCIGGFTFNYLNESFITQNTIKNATGAYMVASNSNNNHVFNNKAYNTTLGLTFDNMSIGNKLFNNDNVTGTNNVSNYIITDQNTSGIRAFLSDVDLKGNLSGGNNWEGTQVFSSPFTITGGSTANYLRGNGSTANFAAAVQNSTIGTVAPNNTPIATSDTFKIAINKAQGQLNNKASLASPEFTGNPTAPTQNLGDNDTKIATTAFIRNEIDAIHDQNDIYIATPSATILNTDYASAPLYFRLYAPNVGTGEEYVKITGGRWLIFASTGILQP